jgi:sedoheptulokinase
VVSDRIISAQGIETRPYFDGKYLAVGAALCGGRAYAVLKDFYKAILTQAADLDDQAVYGIMNNFLKADGEPLSVDTRFAGTRSDESIRGSINGISTENLTPASLTKGVLAGMVGELYDLYSSMGVKISGITGSGNGIRKNKALISLAEDVFGYKMKIPSHTEEAAFGAALYGSIAVKNI